MKKIMLGFAIAGFCVVAAPAVQAQTATPAVAAQEIAIPQPPKFASEEVNKGIAEFVVLIKEFAPSIKANDMQALQAFAPKMQEWEKGASTWAATLSGEDQKKFQDYMMEVGRAIQPSSPAVAPAPTGAPNTADTPPAKSAELKAVPAK